MSWRKYQFLLKVCIFILFLIHINSSSWAMELINSGKTQLDLDSRFQLMGLIQSLEDPHRDDTRLFLFLKQARLSFPGHFDEIDFKVQLAFAGEDQVAAPSPGVALSLLDFYADIPLTTSLKLKIGQFKTPFGREFLTDSKELQFADRSIVNKGFLVGRDVGVTLHGALDMFAYGFGVFTGGGRDVPERYIPEDLGTPMFVLRAGFSNTDKNDIFNTYKQMEEIENSKWGLFFNTLYLEDSLVGHSTVLNVKLADKSLITNSNWNPYIKRSPLKKGHLNQYSLDFNAQIPNSYFTLATEVELHSAIFSNAYGKINNSGARVQVSGHKGKGEVALRYSYFKLDKDTGYFDSTSGVTYPIFNNGHDSISEIGVAFSCFFKRSMKLLLDISYLNVPIVIEDTKGSYSVHEQPDQVSYLKTAGNRVEQQEIYESRLLIQFTF